MSGIKQSSRRFTRGAVLPAAVAWMGLVGASVGLMQTVCVPTPPTPAALVANAGAATSVVQGSVVTILGSATGGTTPYIYTWVQTSGIAQSYTNTGAALSVTGAQVGAATFTFGVTDADGTVATATVVVTVTAKSTPTCTLAATASATPASVVLPATSTLSVAPTGGTAPYTYSWLQTSGSPATLDTPTNQNTIATFPAAGTYGFSVTVKDAGTCTVTATTSVTVTGTPVTADTLFTLNIDNLTGTTGDDVFEAPLQWGSAALVDTLTTGDVANGLAGNDTLNDTIKVALTPSLTAIEVFNLNWTLGVIFNATNCTGVTTINSVNSTANGEVTNINAVTNFGMTATQTDLAVGFATAVQTAMQTGTTDTSTLTLTNVGVKGTPRTFTVSNNPLYLDILNVASAGTANYAVLAQTGGAGTGTLGRINVTGSAPLSLKTAALPCGTAAAFIFDASAATAAVDALMPAKNCTVTGGAGNDRIAFNAAELTTADVVNGGAGTNVIAIKDAALAALDARALALAAVTNFSTLEFFTGAAVTGLDANATAFTSYLFSDVGGGAVTVTNTNNTDTFTFSASAGVCTFSPQTDGLSNVLNVIINNPDGAATLTQIVAGAGSYETIALASNGINGNVVTTLTNKAGGNVTITGSKDLTITAFGTASVLANASAFTGKLKMTGTAGIDDLAGGTGDDKIICSVSTVAVVADTVAGGAGADQFFFSDSAAAGAAPAPTITDFAVGTDILALATGAVWVPGPVGLAQGGGAANSLAVTAAGAPVIKSVAQNAGASAVGTTAQFIKLTTGVAAAATDQLTFDAAIGTSTVTGLTAATRMAGSFYDTTNSQMVVFAVYSGAADTVIASADVISVIARISMTAANYSSFAASEPAVLHGRCGIIREI